MKKLVVGLESKEAVDIIDLMPVKEILAKNVTKLNKLGFSLEFRF